MVERKQKEVRLSLPSKGRLAEDTLNFLEDCGLKVYKPNPRQYEAFIPDLPGLVVLFQRPADIVSSVRDGSVDFGISGIDVIEEHRGERGDLIILHDALSYGHCRLTLAVPESWSDVRDVADLQSHSKDLERPMRVATRYPGLTGRFLRQIKIEHSLISAEGTLETAPSIGYADMISDLVSSGQTLRDNRLKQVSGGVILESQAALIANRQILRSDPHALQFARHLLEFFEAHLRASENLSVFANMRGPSPEAIADRLFNQTAISGLQGPTVSKIIVREDDPNWYAVHIIVQRKELFRAISELRAIGGSGVVVTPVSYIFEEEPPRYLAMLKAIEPRETGNIGINS
jgi:ATP phosphoribosyltransferase